MPGSPRRVWPAYSRTLCLPCLRQVFCTFNTSATDTIMSSIYFFTFCVYVFLRWLALSLALFRDRLLHHGAVHGAHRGPNRADLELYWCRSPWPQTAIQGCTEPSLRFLSKSRALRTRGGSWDEPSAHSSHNRSTLTQRCLFWASLVSVVSLLGFQNRIQGHTKQILDGMFFLNGLHKLVQHGEWKIGFVNSEISLIFLFPS